jgi:hypothetical protein
MAAFAEPISIQLRIVVSGYKTLLFTTQLFSLISSFQIERQTSVSSLEAVVITTASLKSARTISKSTHQVIVTLALFPRTSVNAQACLGRTYGKQ